MNFDEMSKRYENDPQFYKSVQFLYHILYEGHLTVSELRDAAMFAGYKFESENVRPIFMDKRNPSEPPQAGDKK